MRRLALLCLVALPVFAQDWPRFRGPDGDGSWNPQRLPTDLASIKPRQLWKQSIGGGFGGVTISDGRVFVMDRQTTPENVERVLCFDARTGKPLWEHRYGVDYGRMEYNSGPRASVTIHEGRAYAFGATGIATCLDVASGKVTWTHDTVRELGAVIPQWGFAASPLILKDTVLIHCGAKPGGSVVALDLATGRERWRGGNDPAGYSTPALFGSELVQWGPEHVMALEPGTGREIWRVPYKITYGVSIAQPIFHEGIVLVSGYWHGSRAIRASDSQLMWSDEKTLCGLMSQPLYRDGFVYLLTKAEGVVCFNLADGSIRWKDAHLLTPKDRNPQMSLVWADYARGILCGLNAVGELVFARVTPEEIEELSRHSIIGRTWAHPAFGRNTVIARSDTELVAWELWP
ncbi:MAG: PQQ-binding-like beta-propeller repeat protein [Chthoniobacteraceae bacterium]